MSGIAGIIREYSRDAITLEQRENLIEALRHRGPSGITTWAENNNLLVHFNLGSKTNSGNNLNNDQTGVKFLGDIRLDNRSELASALGQRSDSESSDSELVLEAYQRWGTSCCERLLGDFAFAIWDTNTQTMFLARDHFGVRPVFFRLGANEIAFASEAKALTEIGLETYDANYISGYLSGLPEYSDHTGVADVYRLKPGHWLLWKNKRHRVARFWELRPDTKVDADPTGKFKEIFTRSVAARVSEEDNIAAMLSGGLDSSAIVGVADQLLGRSSNSNLRTYSFSYPTNPNLDERRYINAVVGKGNFKPNFLSFEGYKPLGGILESMREQEGPYSAPGLMKGRKLYRAAAQHGSSVILDGHGGDEVVGVGYGPLHQLAMEGRWFKMATLLPAVSSDTGYGRFALLASLLEAYGADRLATRALLQSIRRLGSLSGTRSQKTGRPAKRYLRNEFVKRTNLRERFAEANRAQQYGPPGDQSFHLQTLLSPVGQKGFEELDKASASAGVEARYPFFDVRLAEFCAGLPVSEKLRRGESRSILRRAMTGIYPDIVRRRHKKTNFLPELAHGLVRYHRDVLDGMIVDKDGLLTEFLDGDALRVGVRAFQQMPGATSGQDVIFFWKVACLFLWLCPNPERFESVGE